MRTIFVWFMKLIRNFGFTKWELEKHCRQFGDGV